MTNFEMVERLRSKANVSYEEAKQALEQTNWDILDAMVLLERQGKVSSNDQARYTTREEEPKQKTNRGSQTAKRVGARIVDCVNFLCRNMFEIRRGENTFVKLPVVVLPLLMIFMLWPTLIALIVGLFCGLRYGFSGPEMGKSGINDAMDKAGDMADNIKKDVTKH